MAYEYKNIKHIDMYKWFVYPPSKSKVLLRHVFEFSTILLECWIMLSNICIGNNSSMMLDKKY